MARRGVLHPDFLGDLWNVEFAGECGGELFDPALPPLGRFNCAEGKGKPHALRSARNGYPLAGDPSMAVFVAALLHLIDRAAVGWKGERDRSGRGERAILLHIAGDVLRGCVLRVGEMKGGP